MVLADVDMDLFVATDQDIDAFIGLYAGGDIDLTIDGYNFEQEMSSIQESIGDAGCDMNYILKTFQELYYTYDYMANTFIPVSIGDLEPYEMKLRYVSDLYFVPRTEYEMLQGRMTNLELEIEAIHNLFTEEEVCNGRLSVVKDFNLSSVKCGDTTYYNHMPDGEFMGITPIETEHNYIPEEKPVEEEKDCVELSKDTLAGWFEGKKDLQQLISIYNRDDSKGLDLYITIVSDEVKTAFDYYLDCKVGA